MKTSEKRPGINSVVLDRARKTAEKSTGLICRHWLGEIPIPKALLERTKEK